MLRATKLSVLALILLLGGCSSTTFLYNRLDFLLPWYMGDYVDLDRGQKVLLDDLLEPVLHWHRMQELPRYLVILDDINQRLDKPIGGADFEQISADFEAAFMRLEQQALEMLLLLGEELTELQMAAFLEVLDEEQTEYEEKYLSRDDEEYVEDAYDNLLDGAQDYLGRLDWGQRTGLQEAAGQLRRSDAAWLDERRAWLDRLRVQLHREAGWQQDIRDSLAQREANTSPEYREVYQHNFVVIQGAMAALLNSRSDKQDRRLRKKLNNLREDFETLIRQGQEEAGAIAL